MNIAKFDFKNDWHLVEPHLSDPEVSELLDQGMLHYSRREDKWKHLPLWDAQNGYGPWEYTKFDSHANYAFERQIEDPSYNMLQEKYCNIIEKMGINLDLIDECVEEFLFPPKDPKFTKIANAYQKEANEILEKYTPKKNTYRWYQCFGAADYLSEWSKRLAEKTFPNFTWKTYEKYNRRETNPVFGFVDHIGCTTTIGKNEKGDFLIFDIMLFDSESVDEILGAVGLNRNILQNELE